MARFIKIQGIMENGTSPDGTMLTTIATTTVIPLASVSTVSVVVGRDHANPSVINGLALLISITGGGTIPVSSVSNMNDPGKVTMFQVFVKDVLDRVCGTDDVINIQASTF